MRSACALMKEWIAVPAEASDLRLKLTREALAYVASLQSRKPDTTC